MQIAIIDIAMYAKERFDRVCQKFTTSVVDLMKEQREVSDLGGTMRWELEVHIGAGAKAHNIWE